MDPAPPDELPKACEMCAAWAEPRPPFRLFGDSWYVGSEGLSSVVVRTTDGLVLLDGALPEMVSDTAARLGELGLDPAQVRFVLVSHVHYDHVGGVAAWQRRTGAEVVATAPAAVALRAGVAPPDDPQHGFGLEETSFPPVIGPIRTLADGEALTVGDTTFTLHATPGHTPGGSSWSWSSCDGDRCATVVYADSLNPVSAEDYRFTDHPEVVEALRGSIRRVGALDCDLLVPVHPSFGRLFELAERRDRQMGRSPGADLPLETERRACEVYAENAEKRLNKRLKREQ
ncbi:MAG: subclass B3 metallo-beta-lactamase [Myxococcota bacterium]